jgi:hypothetical protein
MNNNFEENRGYHAGLIARQRLLPELEPLLNVSPFARGYVGGLLRLPPPATFAALPFDPDLREPMG